MILETAFGLAINSLLNLYNYVDYFSRKWRQLSPVKLKIYESKGIHSILVSAGAPLYVNCIVSVPCI